MFRPEICTAVSGATKKEIGRAKEFIWKHMEAELGLEMGTIHAEDYLVSFSFFPSLYVSIFYFLVGDVFCLRT